MMRHIVLQEQQRAPTGLAVHTASGVIIMPSRQKLTQSLTQFQLAVEFVVCYQ